MSNYAKYSGVGGGGGSGGITSINGNTTAAQVIAGGTGISVSTASGTTTITNSAPAGNLAFLTLSGTPSNSMGANETVTWSTNPVLKDTASAFTYSTGIYVIPYTGYWNASFETELINSSGTGANQYNSIDVYDSTTTTRLLGGFIRFTGDTTGSTPLSCNGTFYATANDNIIFRISASASGNTAYASSPVIGTYASLAYLGA